MEKQLVAIKTEAKSAYDSIRMDYDEFSHHKRAFSKETKKMMKAQMAVYAGVYNRDYAMYKKGIDTYEALIAIVVTAPHTQYVVLTDDMQKFGVNEGVQYATSHMDMQTFMRDKLAKYKAIYNQLPRGYFK